MRKEGESRMRKKGETVGEKREGQRERREKRKSGRRGEVETE